MTAGERRWCWTRATLVLALTLVPYAWCWWHTPPGRAFCWVLTGRDDHAVYLSWMRQMAEGSFFLRNLFTTDPQSGRLSNILFFLLAQPVRYLRLAPEVVLQIARLGFGALLLTLVYRFAAYFTESLTARRATFWLAALSAGFGWGDQFGWYDGLKSLPAELVGRKLPTDLWQPESLTYLSISTTALFAAATCAIVGILCLLLEAERTGRRHYAAWAGVLALLLGNFHSYDILHVGVAWGLYLVIKTIIRLGMQQGVPCRSWGDAAACAVIGAPTALLQYLVYRTDPVFQQRAEFQTLSPEFSAYVLGYGLVLPFALVGAVMLVRGVPGTRLKQEQRWMPIVRAVGGFLAAYLPLAFNRKMIMGTHVPLCLLAGIAVDVLGRSGVQVCRRSGVQAFGRSGVRASRRPGREGSSPSEPNARTPVTRKRVPVNACFLTLVLLLSAPTNLLFTLREIRLAGDRPEDLNWCSAYWPIADLRACAWIRDHTPPDASFLCTPTSGRYIAAVAGRTVYVGHWGETPQFSERMRAAIPFFQVARDPEEHLLQVRSDGCTYIYQGTTERRAGQVDFSGDPGLERVYEANGVTIYRVI